MALAENLQPRRIDKQNTWIAGQVVVKFRSRLEQFRTLGPKLYVELQAL